MSASAEGTAAPARVAYLDNLRSCMILLVISMHAADTYSPLGNWYFTDRRPLSTASLLAFAAWQMYLQSFFMGLLFFVAGYFVPSSLARKGAGRFLRDRAWRLGLPVLLYMFVIGPVTEYYFAHSWTSTKPMSFVREWIKHIRNGQFLQENGPLWFCLALLIFCGVYTLARSLRPTPRPPAPAPRSAQLLAFALAMASFTFMVRLGRPVPILNLHLGDFPQYIFLFTAGIFAARGNWLPQLDAHLAARWLLLALTAGFTVWLALLIGGGALQGRASAYSGGWHWQSAGMCLWESFTGVALCFALLVIFRDHLNQQGRVARFLSANAFAVYVFHPPIVIATARVLSALDWHALTMFLMLTAIAAIASFLLSALVFRRIPLLRRIL